MEFRRRNWSILLQKLENIPIFTFQFSNPAHFLGANLWRLIHFSLFIPKLHSGNVGVAPIWERTEVREVKRALTISNLKIYGIKRLARFQRQKFDSSSRKCRQMYIPVLLFPLWRKKIGLCVHFERPRKRNNGLKVQSASKRLHIVLGNCLSGPIYSFVDLQQLNTQRLRSSQIKKLHFLQNPRGVAFCHPFREHFAGAPGPRHQFKVE